MTDTSMLYILYNADGSMMGKLNVRHLALFLPGVSNILEYTDCPVTIFKQVTRKSRRKCLYTSLLL